MASVARERLCDWVVNKDRVWVHGERITDGHVALDMGAIASLDSSVVDRDGQWMIRKHTFPTWLGEGHPDLSDVLPEAGGPGWSEVRWSNWSVAGARIGAANGQAVAVHHEWLSRLEKGYRLEGSADHSVLRIVCEKPIPALFAGPDIPHHAVVGVAVPVQIEGEHAVIQAIVRELSDS